jgi:hypothetical protein
MKKTNVYKRSLELLDEFIAETSNEDLTALISKHANSKIKGPTFDEYLEYFQEEFENIDWRSESNNLDVEVSCKPHYNIYQRKIGHKQPPPITKKFILNNQGSAIKAEPFFV